MQDDFQTKLAYGQDGEREIAYKMMQGGFYVLPLYQFTASVAPIIETIKEKHLISPDLICFKDGKVCFVESKRKNQWVTFTGENETGINLRHYNEYKTLSDETGIPLFLTFLQESKEPTGIYFTEIHNEHTRSWNGYGNYSSQTPMVFFTSESLTKIG